jgi:hypothetical protein
MDSSMDLRECKFYSSGRDFNFSVFSDDVCRVRHLQSVSLPLGGEVDVYGIEPGSRSHWVAIRQTEDGHEQLRCFVKVGESFKENSLTPALRNEVWRRFPALIPKPPLAA